MMGVQLWRPTRLAHTTTNKSPNLKNYDVRALLETLTKLLMAITKPEEVRNLKVFCKHFLKVLTFILNTAGRLSSHFLLKHSALSKK